jgi:hypothetical protein
MIYSDTNACSEFVMESEIRANHVPGHSMSQRQFKTLFTLGFEIPGF